MVSGYLDQQKKYMMEVLSYELNLSEIVPFDVYSFESDSVYLWVLHADKVPPHIGVSSEGSYFSLKSNGKDQNLPISSVRSIVERKGIKTLLFKLDCNVSAKDIEEQFSLYTKTITNQVTCLNPLRNILNFSDARILKDLLAELNNEQLIQSVVGINIDDSFKGIQDYKIEDIHHRLRKLDNG